MTPEQKIAIQALAEQMGASWVEPFGTSSGPIYGKLPAGGGYWIWPDGSNTYSFTPLINANDDCLVLKWVDSLKPDSIVKFDWDTWDILIDCQIHEYYIGFFAECACDALGIPLPSQDSDK